MTPFFDKVFTRYPIKTRRFLEILPGIISWTLILLPIWGALLFPTLLAYFILFFDVYWFYKSFSLVVTAAIASRKIKEAEHIDWYQKAKALPNFSKVHHVLIIPTYKESKEKLSKTLDNLLLQSLPLKQLHIVLGMEEREEHVKEKSEELSEQYKGKFGSFFATFHPDLPGEVKGKSSNEAFAGRESYEKLFVKGSLDINFGTISSVDADSMFDKEYFAYLTHSFLTDTKPYNKFWQSAIVFYNNMWQVPSPTRIISFFGGLYRTALLIQGDKCLTHATYSTSMQLMQRVGFWDVDVIPEDYRIFFKAFYKMGGQVWVEPIFLKTSLDAVQSHGYINSLKSRYEQERRWSWGVSDQPLFIKWWLTVPNVPFIRKTVLLSMVLMDHVLWPVHWFIITVAANIIPLVNPVFSRTSLGLMLPRLAGSILTFGLLAILILIYIDYKNRPSHIILPWYRKLFFPFEFILMPLIGFFLSALPALISHTQLMFGRRMEYKVTEKI